MPRTSATRPKGSGIPAGGAGWGGGAKGAGKPPGNRDNAGVPRGAQSVADIMAEAGARELAAQRWLEILNDPAHPRHAEMVAKAAERLDGAPVQRTDLTSQGERIGYVIPAPPEAEDAEAWARQYAPR